MAFMTPEYEQGEFTTIERNGEYVWTGPSEYADPQDGDTVTTCEGWFCRLSAAGYMDQTDWEGPYKTEAEAREAISDLYDVDPDTGDDLMDGYPEGHDDEIT